MKQLLLLLTQTFVIFSIAQPIPNLPSGFQKSENCQRNNNTNCSPIFNNVIRSTFKYSPALVSGKYGGCTGTLINIDVPQGDLGVYFISARHCIVNDRLVNQDFDVDFNKEWIFYFNYQSPDCNDESILEFKNLFI